MNTYRRRVVDRELDELLPYLPAVLLDGPKGVGKTETSLQRAGTVRRLDEPGQRSIAEADPGAVLVGSPPVLLDEWHRVPVVWDAVKRAVDADTTAGRFLLTGSASFGDEPTHSGAGRITALRMRPMTLPERGAGEPTVSLRGLLHGEGAGAVGGSSDLGLDDYVELILRSGFPGFQSLEGRALRAQLDGYLDRIVERDMPEAGLQVRRPATVRAWLRAYAAATATTATWETIRDASTSAVVEKPAKTTTMPYVDLLTGLSASSTSCPPGSPGTTTFAASRRAPSITLRTPLSPRGCSASDEGSWSRARRERCSWRGTARCSARSSSR